MSDTDEGVTPDPENSALAMYRLKYKDGFLAGVQSAMQVIDCIGLPPVERKKALEALLALKIRRERS